MTFGTVEAAQHFSRKHGLHIFVEIEHVDGVLEVYPGGRAIFCAASPGRVYQRYRKALTPDRIFACSHDMLLTSECPSCKRERGLL